MLVKCTKKVGNTLGQDGLNKSVPEQVNSNLTTEN